jgi:hypothetical protein
MSTGNDSEASAAGTRTSASGWGVEDPEVRLTGVHLRVLGGRPVWPLAFHEFVMARDAFVEQRTECRDFSPVPVGSGSAGSCLLEELLSRYVDGWGTTRVPAVEVDCVLAALGLLHMRVKCVIPEELGGDYEPAVSVCLPGACIAVYYQLLLLI